MPIVGKLIASRMPQHMGVDREWELRGFSNPGDRFQKSCGCGRTAAFGEEDVSGAQFLPTAALSSSSGQLAPCYFQSERR
jgi:hypothetical protein